MNKIVIKPPEICPHCKARTRISFTRDLDGWACRYCGCVVYDEVIIDPKDKKLYGIPVGYRQWQEVML